MNNGNKDCSLLLQAVVEELHNSGDWQQLSGIIYELVLASPDNAGRDIEELAREIIRQARSIYWSENGTGICSGLQTKQLRLANKGLCGPTIIENKGAVGPTFIANEPTIIAKSLQTATRAHGD
jgi:hypothetical protein